MDSENQSRREFFKVAVSGAAAASTIAFAASTAQAYQGNMERALSSLNEALVLLRRSTADKGGHRGTAMGLVEHAIGEVQAGINYAARTFGD